MQAERYIAAADLGSSKIALSVAKVTGDDIQIIYYKETPSDGIRYSCVFNPKRAAIPLRAALKEAEEELNIKILQVVIGLPRYNVRQEIASAKMERSDPSSCITKEEINSLKSMAIDSYPISDDTKEEIFGAVAQSFSTEELSFASENDIVGTTADAIEGNFKVIIGTKKSVRNIDIMLNDAEVAPACKMFVPNTVAKAVLTEGERENGVALVELGADVSSVTIFKNKILRHYSSIPFGGKSITTDIKYECGFTDRLSENIKLAFGACMPDKLLSLSEKIIQINDDEDGTYDQLPVKYLSEIITSRATEIIEAILYQIQESDYADKLRNGIVITGGGANLTNIANLIREMSGYTVRVGYPRNREFSATGCNGVFETSAAASIGMILEAKKDPRLNCIEDVPLPQEEHREERAVEHTPEPVHSSPASNTPVRETTGEIFSEPQKFGPEDVITPSHGKKDVKKPNKITWTDKLKKKISNGLEGAFDSAVGNLFDSME